MVKKSRHSKRDQRSSSLILQERLHNHRVFKALLIVVLLVVCFIGGFLLRGQTALMSQFGFGLQGTTAPGSAVAAKTVYNALSARVSDVEDMLQDNSLDTYDLDPATELILSAVMEATGDPYAAYYSPTRYETFLQDSNSESYAGIGVLFADYDGRAYAADVFSGCEAEAEGVQQGDYVVSIDGDSSHDWTMTEVVGALSRDEGERVVITWMRPSATEAETGLEFTTTLTCHVYEEENVTAELRENVGIITLKQMTQNASELVNAAIDDLTDQGARGFILDVRGNPGGYLTQAVDTASLFVQSGVLVQIHTKDGDTTKNASGTVATDAPLVVLDDRYTAAAAEVLVAALKDNQRALVVGETTMGKGSIQVVRELSFGGAVRYTAAYYLTPLGREIDNVGVSPDVSVEQVGEDTDTQLLVALDTIRDLIPE